MNFVKPIQLQELILIRLATSPDKGLATSELRKSLNPLFASPPSIDKWSNQLTRLVEQNLSQKMNQARYCITTLGMKSALQILGILPSSNMIYWAALKNCYLLPLALGLPAPSNDRDRHRISSANGLRAQVLAQVYQLPIGPYPTLVEARDYLLWQQLTDPQVSVILRNRLSTSDPQPFTQNNLMTLLLNTLLDSTRELSWESALRQLVAKATHARRTDPEEIRLAIFKAATTESSLSTLKQPADLEAFATQIMESANRCQTGRFGKNKIFISHVWKQMGIDSKQSGLDFNKFKQLLTLANNKGLINLSRADLAQAMNQEDVTASETHYLTATFHFIRLESNNV
ncbi:hypothetical protein [Nitrosomonas sp. Nm132]|uniref:hypothetical protein n=1 Tax=Nitrosomonas sp. Nm132 TaxID=1881053 RepID=UPI0008809C15|nr:hypothetical protein [Nitrosomonas sp. Nm132]SDH80825.1 hypothetical protein SAMN05428952_103316 [Nitrosomonas sp. Nm132]